MNIRGTLFLLLVAALAFKAGMALDRWLGRPILIQCGEHIGEVLRSTTRVEDVSPQPCFSDKPESCPTEPTPAPPKEKSWSELPTGGIFPERYQVCTFANAICWTRI